MKEQEHLQLHGMLDLTGKWVLESEDFDGIPRDFFPFYGELGLKSVDVFAKKSEHREAIMTLSRSIGDFIKSEDEDDFYERLIEREDIDDELKIGILGRYLSENDVGRREAAERISSGVNMNSDTVYEKFSQHSIYFNLHGEERQTEALDLMKSYAEGDSVNREAALGEVSDETGVAEGTLRNWLTDEGVTFTEDVSALVEPESKEELIDTVEHYFNIEKGQEAIEQALGYKVDTLRLYRDDEIESMPVELLERLDRVFESVPRFRMDDLERYVEEDTRYGLKLDDSFQSFLFNHISGEELEGMTGKSSSTLTRYRNNRTKTVDQEAYRKAFQAVSHIYDKHPEPEIQGHVHRESFGSGAPMDEVEAALD